MHGHFGSFRRVGLCRLRSLFGGPFWDVLILTISSGLPTTGVASYTAPTSAIRLRSRFSPRETRVASSGRAAAAAFAVAGRNASGRMTMPLPSTESTSTSSADARCRHDDPNGRYAIRAPITRSCHPETRFPQKGFALLGERRTHVSVIFENVGNLVCPSSFDLGEDAKVVLLSTTEGEDKPIKYPAIFRHSTGGGCSINQDRSAALSGFRRSRGRA